MTQTPVILNRSTAIELPPDPYHEDGRYQVSMPVTSNKIAELGEEELRRQLNTLLRDRAGALVMAVTPLCMSTTSYGRLYRMTLRIEPHISEGCLATLDGVEMQVEPAKGLRGQPASFSQEEPELTAKIKQAEATIEPQPVPSVLPSIF